MDLDFPYELEAIAELQGHVDRAWNVAWNPAKPFLASCSGDKSVRIYHYSDANLSFECVYTISSGHSKTVRALTWAPSGETLATASFDATVAIWQQEEAEEGSTTREWECVAALDGHETECKGVAYSCTGTLLATCSRDKTVWVWEVQPDAEYECMSVMMEHSQDVKCVAWHPTEEILASGSYDDTINLYIDDPSDDWYKFATLIGHTSTVWSLAFSPCGQYLASASDDRTIRVWERVEKHRWESKLTIEGHDRTVYSISWGVGASTDHGSLGWIVSAGGDGKIKVWEISTSQGALVHKLIATVNSAHGVHDVNRAVWCPRPGLTNLISSAGDDGVVRVWKVTPVAVP